MLVLKFSVPISLCCFFFNYYSVAICLHLLYTWNRLRIFLTNPSFHCWIFSSSARPPLATRRRCSGTNPGMLLTCRRRHPKYVSPGVTRGIHSLRSMPPKKHASWRNMWKIIFYSSCVLNRSFYDTGFAWSVSIHSRVSCYSQPMMMLPFQLPPSK